MRIFENSAISVDLEERRIPGMILGDAGYSCLPYLMTPYPCPTTQPQKRYLIFNFSIAIELIV